MGNITENTVDEDSGLKKVITMPMAVSIYVSSVLGAGILIMPGIAAKASGQASIVAWVLLSFLSYPFAYIFAKLASIKPVSGGIYSFSKDAFGSYVSNFTGWLFLAWYALGAPANSIAAGEYLSYSLPMSRPEVYLFAGFLILLAFAVNYVGIKFSARVQMVVIVAIILVILVAIFTSVPHVNSAQLSPLVPDNNFYAIGTASALIIWAFFGYENVPNLAGEFSNPKRDLNRSVVFSVLIVGILYTSVSIVTVGTDAYSAGAGATPFAYLLSAFFGTYGSSITAAIAVIAVFSAMNAYTAGMSRVIYAVSRSHGLPHAISKVHPKTGIPHRAVVLLSGLALITLFGYYLLNINLVQAFLMVSGVAGVVYVVGSASAIRLLKEKGARKLLPWISLVASLVIISFIDYLLVVAATIIVVSLAYTRKYGRVAPGRESEQIAA